MALICAGVRSRETKISCVYYVIGEAPRAKVRNKYGSSRNLRFIFDDYDGAATPLHIIAKNERLITQFESSGYVRGLQTELNATNIAHEDFYNLFMSRWLNTFATDPVAKASSEPNTNE